MFDHFVITRFNLKFKSYYREDKNGNFTQTEAWLKRRFELFETYCFPSLQGQSCTNFKWLVLFDKATPIEYKKKIDAYKKQFLNFSPLFLENGETEYIHPCLIEAISLFSNEKTQHIITTRIDNDDAFHKDMIKDVQLFYSKNKEEGFLNYNYGIQYDVDTGCAVSMYYENNHFLSRLEGKKNLDTVIIHDHTQIDKVAKIFSVDNKAKPLWIEVVHDSNLTNRIRLTRPIFSSNYFKQFNLNVVINKKNSVAFLIKYLKKMAYEILASFFSNIGLFEAFKTIIKVFK